ncbi:MAG: thioredoxin [Spirochaetaceae bacterium]|nr:MAG: thioredoxin [Spirochaetaceae bacterium]
MSNEIVLTNDNFKKEVLESNIPVLVDFWAAWCVPCKMMEPILGQLSADYAGKLKVGKLNVDEEAELASSYNIVSLPTLLVFSKGQVADKRVGAVPRQVLEEFIKDHI